MVKVIAGANNGSYSMEDLGTNPTIANVRNMFVDLYNIADDAKVLVGNPNKQVPTEEVDEGYSVRDGDEIEFVQGAGDKGIFTSTI